MTLFKKPGRNPGFFVSEFRAFQSLISPYLFVGTAEPPREMSLVSFGS